MSSRSDAPAVYVPPVAVALAAMAIFYAILWPIVMQDVGNDYIPWLAHVATKGASAFATPIGNYNPPYWYMLALVSPLYGIVPAASLIKLVSVVGSIALWWATYRLLHERGVTQPGRWAALVMVMPSHVLNTAFLGSGDSLWAAPCVAALGCALSRRHTMMLLWCAVALSIKFQAILFAPFVIAVLLRRRVPWRFWAIVPAVYVAMLLPAALLGWPVSDLATVYVHQAGFSQTLSLNAPNLWFLVQSALPETATALSGLALVAAIVASAGYIVYFARRLPQDDTLVGVALLCLLITAGLLPHMHERYFFLADIVALIAAALSGTRRAWRIALLVQGASVLSVWAYATGAAWLVDIGAVAMLVATFLVARPLFQLQVPPRPVLAAIPGT